MSDNDKPKLGMRAPLGLKRTVETGKVKQSFSHGRSNTVVVEVKRRRILAPGGHAEAPAQGSCARNRHGAGRGRHARAGARRCARVRVTLPAAPRAPAGRTT